MDKCPICLDIIDKEDKITTLDCGHIYHTICIDEWNKRVPICPLCKRLIETNFRIYTHKTKFFRNYFMLSISNNEIVVHKIKKKHKLILNPCFLRLLRNQESIYTNDLLKKNEQIGNKILTIDVKSLLLISYIYKTERLVVCHRRPTIFSILIPGGSNAVKEMLVIGVKIRKRSA